MPKTLDNWLHKKGIFRYLSARKCTIVRDCRSFGTLMSVSYFFVLWHYRCRCAIKLGSKSENAHWAKKNVHNALWQLKKTTIQNWCRGFHDIWPSRVVVIKKIHNAFWTLADETTIWWTDCNLSTEHWKHSWACVHSWMPFPSVNICALSINFSVTNF